MSDPKGEPVRSDLDFDVVAIDLSWSESFGDPVFGGTQTFQGSTWEDAFKVEFYRVVRENPSQNDPGAGEKGALTIPIATSSKRGGSKSAQGGVVNARLSARPADWFARLAINRISTIILAVGMVSACTTASDHTEVIKQFAAATGSAKDALVAYDQAAAQRMTTIVRTEAVAQKKRTTGNTGPGFVIADEDCGTESAKCEAFFKETREDPDPKPLTVATIIPEHVAAAKAIVIYTDALKAVTEADSRTQVKGALDQAAAATSALANVVQPRSGVIVQPFAGATANALAFLYGKYQEKLQVNALREATQQMNPHIKGAADKFGKIASLADLAGRTTSAKAVEDARAAFEESPSAATINAVADRVNNFDQELKVPPVEVFANIADIHQKLTDGLVKGPQSFKELFEAVNRLAADAEALQAIAMQFKEAAEAKEAAEKSAAMQ